MSDTQLEFPLNPGRALSETLESAPPDAKSSESVLYGPEHKLVFFPTVSPELGTEGRLADGTATHQPAVQRKTSLSVVEVQAQMVAQRPDRPRYEVVWPPSVKQARFDSGAPMEPETEYVFPPERREQYGVTDD